MRRVSALPCHCWRLTRPLAGEALPDHVCPQTAAGTIYNGPPIAGAELTPDLGWPVLYRHPGGWGTPHRQLGLVLREWAEEEPSRTLANQLRSSWDWNRAVAWIRGDFVRWRQRHAAAPLSDWIAVGPDDPRYAALLWRWGFPATPATLRFLRACTAYQTNRSPTRDDEGGLLRVTDDGGTEPVVLPSTADEEERRERAWAAVLTACEDAFPARGLLITTLVFVCTGPLQEHGVRYDPKPEVLIEGPLDLATGGVLDSAGRVARKHRDWMRERFGGHELADPSAIHRSKPGA